MQETGILDSSGTDDDVGDAIVQISLDRVEITNAAAQLDRNLLADHTHDFPDGELVPWLAGNGAVQVDEMQPRSTQLQPVLRHCGGIFGEHGDRMHVALFQTHAMTVLDVDRGDDLHGSRVAAGGNACIFAAGEKELRWGQARPSQATKLARN